MNFAVRATDPAFLESLRGYVGRYRVGAGSENETLFSADSGQTRTLAGGKVLRGKKNLYWKTLKVYEGRQDDEMIARLAGFVREWATVLSNEFLRLRAGGIVIEGKAVVFPSTPQKHLPALVGLLVRDGGGFLGDEMVNVDPILHRIHGLALPLRVDVDDMTYFPELGREPSRQTRWRLGVEPGYEAVTIRRAVGANELGSSEADPAPAGWIVFPEFRSGEDTRLEPFGGAEALFRFSQAVLNLHVWEERALVLLRQVLEDLPVSRLVIGSLPDAASLVSRTAPGMLKGVTT